MYEAFAQVYDTLNGSSFYDEWFSFVSHFLQPGDTILDLGCGSGTLLAKMSRAGHPVTGVDMSENMLVLAQEKLLQSGTPFELYEYDMSEFLADSASYDIIVSSCDSINYLEEATMVETMFRNIETMLKPGGFFIFDVHSNFTFEERFKNWVYVDMQETLSVVWECENEKENQFNHYLTFFEQLSDDLYERYDELHEQYYYPKEELVIMLEKSGLEVEAITSDFKPEFHVDGERTFFIVKRKS